MLFALLSESSKAAAAIAKQHTGSAPLSTNVAIMIRAYANEPDVFEQFRPGEQRARFEVELG